MLLFSIGLINLFAFDGFVLEWGMGTRLLVQYHLLFVGQEYCKIAVHDLLNFSLWIILCVAL